MTYQEIAEKIKTGQATFGQVIQSLRQQTQGKVSRNFDRHVLVALGMSKSEAFAPPPMRGAKDQPVSNELLAWEFIEDWIDENSEYWQEDGILVVQLNGLWKVK